MKFAIDTGTARTVIDSRVARALALPRSRLSLEAFGTRAEADAVTLHTLSIGSISVKRLQVLVQDLEAQQQRFGLRLDGLVGVDVLRGQCVTIDYHAKRLAVGCHTGWRQQTSFTPPLPLVEIRIDGNPYRLIADTGSEAIVLFAESVPPGVTITPDLEVEGRDLLGIRLLKRFTPRSFLVGRYAIGPPPVFLMSGSCARCGYDGVLGTRWLPGEKVYFDFRDGHMGWN